MPSFEFLCTRILFLQSETISAYVITKGNHVFHTQHTLPCSSTDGTASSVELMLKSVAPYSPFIQHDQSLSPALQEQSPALPPPSRPEILRLQFSQIYKWSIQKGTMSQCQSQPDACLGFHCKFLLFSLPWAKICSTF